mgnify:CR=1 FL=1
MNPRKEGGKKHKEGNLKITNSLSGLAKSRINDLIRLPSADKASILSEVFHLPHFPKMAPLFKSREHNPSFTQTNNTTNKATQELS